MRARFVCYVLAASIGFLASARADRLSLSRGPTTAPYQSDTARYIDQLGDPDPAVRNVAKEAILAAPDAARSLLRIAAVSDDPQRASAARETLRALPWFVSTDPPDVVNILKNYGSASVTDRFGDVQRLAELPDASQSLLRLLTEEMNEDVCWQIVSALQQRVDPQGVISARRMDLAGAGGAAFWLAGDAWLKKLKPPFPPADRNRGLQLLQMAIDRESSESTFDGGRLDGAFDALVSAALDNDQPAEALRLRRIQCKRIAPAIDAYPMPFFALLTLHERYGPLPGFQQDLQDNERFLDRPEVLAVLSRIELNAGRQLMAEVDRQLALTSAFEPRTQELAAAWLQGNDYADLAAAQYRQILSRGSASADEFDVDARLSLALLATRRDDDASALQQLQIALDDRDKNIADDGQAQSIRISIAIHEFRIARHKDELIARGAATQLASLVPDSTDAAIELVPWYAEHGQIADANRLFDTVYAPLLERVENSDSNSTENEIAWLCACCDRNLPQALKWAEHAVADSPRESAYLDTCATVNDRMGRSTEAARLERKALKFSPGDLFMREQLHKFEEHSAHPTTQERR